MKKNITIFIVLVLFGAFLNVAAKSDIQHGRHPIKVLHQENHDHDKEQSRDTQPVKTMGKKLTSPLITVLDKAVQFRPEIMLKMQMAAGRSDKVFKSLTTKKVLVLQEKKAALEGILHHVAEFFSEMSQHSSRVVPLIRESLFGTTEDVKDQHSFLLEYFEVVSTAGSKDTLLTYLLQKINTTDQLKVFCEHTKIFFTDVYASLSDEAKAAVEKFKKQLQESAERAKEGTKKA